MQEDLRSRVRSMVEYCAARATDDLWLAYARAWLDGSLMAGRHIDYITGHPATPRIFVTDCLVASCHAAKSVKGRDDEMIYERARLLEDVAWAVRFLEEGEDVPAEQAIDRVRSGLKKGVVLNG